MGDATAVYQRLLTEPGNADCMAVLADALEEAGDTQLAVAYRWAARRGRWPFERMARYPRPANCPQEHAQANGRVYDWDGEGRDVPVPEECRLPRHLYRAMRNLPDREYSDVNQAFVLLARVLAQEGEELCP